MKTAKSQTPFIEAANFGPSIEIRCVCVRVCAGDRKKKKIQVQNFPKKWLSPRFCKNSQSPDFIKTH